MAQLGRIDEVIRRVGDRGRVEWNHESQLPELCIDEKAWHERDAETGRGGTDQHGVEFVAHPLHRPVIVDTETGEEITAQNGRYGPYLKKGTDSRSLETEEGHRTVERLDDGGDDEPGGRPLQTGQGQGQGQTPAAPAQASAAVAAGAAGLFALFITPKLIRSLRRRCKQKRARAKVPATVASPEPPPAPPPAGS